jgi:hypothetical protein
MLRPFHPDPDHYKPTNVTGAGAELRAGIDGCRLQVPAGLAQQHRGRPAAAGGWTGTAEFLYNRDVNGIYYINANLPAAQTAFVGADSRPAGRATASTERRQRHRAEEPERGATSWNLARLSSKKPVPFW